jgi:hypothetical protein
VLRRDVGGFLGSVFWIGWIVLYPYFVILLSVLSSGVGDLDG